MAAQETLNAEHAVVRHALVRGYLTQEQLRQALLLRDQLRAAERPAELLAILRARFLSAAHLPELGQVYRQALGGRPVEPGGRDRSSAALEDDLPTLAGVESPFARRDAAGSQRAAALPDPAAISEDIVERSSELLARPPEEDPEDVQAFLLASSDGEPPPVDEEAPTILTGRRRGEPERTDRLAASTPLGQSAGLARSSARAAPSSVDGLRRSSSQEGGLRLRPGLILDLIEEQEGVTEKTYIVRDRHLGRRASLRLLREDDRDLAARFRREAEVLARLDHPCMAPVYEVGTDAADRPYVLTRAVSGETLAERVASLHARGRPTLGALREVLEVLLRVAEAVAYAHAQGIVHRDLRPEHVLVGAYGEIHLTGWAQARDLSGATADSVLVRTIEADLARAMAQARAQGLTDADVAIGTPGYAAPEQLRGGQVDARADVFALGALLVTVLTGRPPVHRDTALGRIEATLAGEVATPRQRDPRVPAALEAIAAQALAADPERRTPTATAFALYLRDHLHGRPVALRPPNPLERAWSALAAHPGLLLAVAVLGVVVAVGGLLAWQRGASDAAAAEARVEALEDEVDALRAGEGAEVAPPEESEEGR